MVPTNKSRCLAVLAWLLLIASAAAAADEAAFGDESEQPFVGRPVSEIIDTFREANLPFAYSTLLLSDDMLVESEPQPGTPVEIATEILRPHRLTIRTEAGVHLVVPLHPGGDDATPLPVPDRPVLPPAGTMENVIVSASRYAIARDFSTSRYELDQRSIQNLPDIGEDPIRAAQRLPGAAASGASAVAHFRGGEQGEVGIMLNGQWLFDPYHMRDYQNIFSAIDARAIDGVEVYMGGFPVRYGDRMSGLVLMDSLDVDKHRHNEIGISVFNTSFLTTGRSGRRQWLLSARRGNLDLVIDPRFGQPSYFDVFAEFAYDFSPDTRLSVNALYADDAVDIVLENEPSERDQVSSDTQNAQVWLRLDSRWSDALSSTTVLSLTDYTNRRTGFTNDRDKMVARVDDYREVRRAALRQDWLWSASDRHRTQWGIQASSASARFDYRGDAEYFGLPAQFIDQPATVSRRTRSKPEGGSYALYVSDRWKLGDKTFVEWGLRWDDQTYTDLSSDSQLSPRLSVLTRPWQDTEIRVSVGRYFQSQPIQSLQVEDGVDNYWPAQRADHLIVGVQRWLQNDVSVRLEVFYKDFGQVRPRFENLFDPLGLMPELQADRVRISPESARARGVELSIDRRVGATTWWGAYSWSRVTDEVGGADVVRSWDQTHALQGGIDWCGERWNFSAAANVHSGWPTTGLRLDDNGIAVPLARNAERHDTFASVDLRLSRTFDVRRGTLMAFVEISNLLNRRNPCCIDWDLTEDANDNEILERGQDYWMPLLPAVGILWEF